MGFRPTKVVMNELPNKEEHDGWQRSIEANFRYCVELDPRVDPEHCVDPMVDLEHRENERDQQSEFEAHG